MEDVQIKMDFYWSKSNMDLMNFTKNFYRFSMDALLLEIQTRLGGESYSA